VNLGERGEGKPLVPLLRKPRKGYAPFVFVENGIFCEKLSVAE
jgi:hypothetical protein